jgi:hypothetical protein
MVINETDFSFNTFRVKQKEERNHYFSAKITHSLILKIKKSFSFAHDKMYNKR